MTTELEPISEETNVPEAKDEEKIKPEMPKKSEPPKPAGPELRITNPEGDK